MFTYELQRRLAAKGAPTIALAAHPGVSDTELMRHIPGSGPAVSSLRPGRQSAEMGALADAARRHRPRRAGRPVLRTRRARRAARAPESSLTSSKQSHDEDLQRRLWDVSEELTGVTYPV